MEAGTFLDKIKPPRLEDAGLEDCALPPESIKEAFLKAASALRSVVSASDDEDESTVRCVEDPWEDSSDALVGITEGVNAPPEGCAAKKGGGETEAPGDEVVIEGDNTEAKPDAVVSPGLPEGGDACIDALQGLEIGEKSRVILGKKERGGEDDVAEDDERNEGPILVGGYV